jgi:hypothetical protein
MNSRQRRKARRQQFGKAKPLLIRNWAELAQVPPSKTHRLEIDEHNGWIPEIGNEDRLGIYLSTHTFYGSTHERSTQKLRRCGFNVTIANWDEETAG